MRELCDLVNDFSCTAKDLAKVIINEINLEDEYKTIKPNKKIGGEVGGIKYIHHEIFVSIKQNKLLIFYLLLFSITLFTSRF